MTKRVRTTRSKEPLVWETVKPKVLVRILLTRLSSARDLLGEIDSVSSLHEQICSIEESLKLCDGLFNEYDSRQIGYQSFKTRLRNQLTASLLDELKFLGFPVVSHSLQKNETPGSPGCVLNNIAMFEEGLEGGEPLDRQKNKLVLQEEEFGQIVDRLLVQIRSESFTLEYWLKDLYRWE